MHMDCLPVAFPIAISIFTRRVDVLKGFCFEFFTIIFVIRCVYALCTWYSIHFHVVGSSIQ